MKVKRTKKSKSEGNKMGHQSLDIMHGPIIAIFIILSAIV